MMVSVAVVFPLTVTEVGFRMQLIPVGAVHVKATAALKPLMEPRFSVAVPVEPAVTVTFGFCASMEKSVRGLLSDKPNCDGAYAVSPEYVITTGLFPWGSEREELSKK